VTTGVAPPGLRDAGLAPEAVARALAPAIEARAGEIEAARRLPADLSATLAGAGVYRWFVPACYGGLDTPLPEAMRAIELLAHADASVAWCAFIAITSSTVLGFVPESVAREVCTTPETLIAGVFHPMGRADAVPGGFRVGGQWSFASGAWNAGWLCAGCLFYEGDAPLRGPGGLPRTSMVLFPAAEAELLDTWNVAGLAGTGSIDFRLRDVFVPTERVVGWSPRPALAHPLYAFPLMTLLATGFGPIALGLARAALDELEALATDKRPAGSSRLLAERADVQAAIARGEAAWASARAWLHEVQGRAWDAACAGDVVALAQRRDVRLATLHAADTAVRVVGEAHRLAGASALAVDAKLARVFRDLHGVTQHVAVRPTFYELVGRTYLGIDKDTQFL